MDPATAPSGASGDSSNGDSQNNVTPESSSNEPNTHHNVGMTTAQKVFSGKHTSSAGLMCSNLRSNPFSVASDSTSGVNSGILAKPKFSLKPSGFATAGLSSTNKTAQTGVATTNPFLRPAKLNYDSDDTTEGDKLKAATGDAASEATDIKTTTNNLNTDSNSAASSNSETNMSTTSQAPLLGASAFGTSITSRASQSSFIFGEALDDRVKNVNKEASNNGTNGHSEPEVPAAKTMEQAVEEYKKEQESGPILPEVATVTGEEGEANVLQINCKMFLFNDKDSSWSEKGRGLLRLNDDLEGVHSRIVMRTAGIHRVILNTNIWHAMLCERANQKSIRITGTEEGQVHVYLITGSVADIDHLFSAVTYRIKKMKTTAGSGADASTSEANATAKRKTDDDSETSPKKLKSETGDSN